MKKAQFVSTFLACAIAIAPFQAVKAANVFEKAMDSIANDLDRKINRQLSGQKNGTEKSREKTEAERNEPRMSRATRRQVQRSLNLLDYEAGTEDGILGSGSRAAIARFQSAKGYAATGYLTDAQLSELRGMDADALANKRNLEDKGMQVALSRDDTRKLQTALQSLGYYKSAVDGLFDEETNLALRSFMRDYGFDPDDSTQAEMLGLAAQVAGLENNSDDQNSGEFSIMDTLGEEPSADTNILLTQGDAEADGPFDAGSYHPHADESGFDLTLELSRRVVAEIPAVLNPRSAMEKWIKTEFPEHSFSKGDARATPDTIKFYNGTEFDRQDAVASIREQLYDNATNEPLKHKFSFSIGVFTAKYQQGRGFPVRFPNGGNYQKAASVENVSTFLDHLGRDIEYFFPNAPDVSYLPADEARAREIATLLNDNPYNKLQLNLFVSLNGIRDEIRNKGTTSREAFQALAKLDAVEIVVRGRKGSQITAPLTLYTWDLLQEKGNSSVQGQESIEEYARWLKIPMLNNSLVSYNNFSSLNFILGRNEEKRNVSAWRRLQYLSHLNVDPALLDDDDLLLSFADRTLTTADKRLIARGKPLFESLDPHVYGNGYPALSEFEQVEVKAELRSDYRNKILAKAVPYPVPVVEITQAKIGKYDFNREGFVIDWSDSSGQAGDRGVFGDFNIKFSDDGLRPHRSLSNFKSYPNLLPVPKDKAEKLAKLLENKKSNQGRRFIYLAVFANLDAPTIDDGRLLFDFQAHRAAIYADVALTELIGEIPVSLGWPTPAEVLSGVDATVIPLTADTAYLWVAKTNPELLDDPAFMENAFDRRLRAEVKGGEEALWVDSYFPEEIRNRKTAVDSRDREAFKAIYSALAEAADFSTIRMIGGFRANRKASGELEINLHDHFTQNHIQRAEPKKAAREFFPDGLDNYLVNEQGNFPIILANKSQNGWYGFDFPFETDAKANEYGRFPGHVDLSVQSMSVFDADKGRRKRPGMLVVVAPKAVAIGPEGSSRSIYEFDEADDTAAGVLNPDYANVDVRGLHLGMELEEAIEFIMGEEEGLTRRNISSGPKEYSLSDGVELARLDPNGRNEMVFLLLTGTGELEGKLIAVANVQNYEAKKLDRNASLEAVFGKYGKADYTNAYSGGDSNNVWIINPESKKRVVGDYGINADCETQPNRVLYLSNRGGMAQYSSSDLPRLNTGEIREDCGVVLIVMIDEHGSSSLLFDTTQILASRREALNLEKAKAEKLAQETKAVTKF